MNDKILLESINMKKNKEKKEINRNDRIRKPNILVQTLIRGLFGSILRVFLYVRTNRDKEIDNLEGPVIFIGNHVSAIDPVAMGAFASKRWIHYVTSSSYFEYAVVALLLNYFGAISKRQGTKDVRATKKIVRILRDNGVVGLFPEAARTIDGSSLPFNDSVARLAKQTKSNIVVSKMHGAAISLPRWYKGCSGGYRYGRIQQEAYVLLKKEEVKEKSADEIHEMIVKALSYNEYEWQKVHKVKYRSKSMADGMHSILHKCPKCLKDFSMATYENLLFCKECDNRVIVDEYGLLRAETRNDASFEDMVQWRTWQNGYLRKEVADDDFSMRFRGSLRIKDIDGKVTKEYKICTLIVDKENVTFTYGDFSAKIPYSSITDVVSDYSYRFEINLETDAYQFAPRNGQTVIKISDSIKCIKGILV